MKPDDEIENVVKKMSFRAGSEMNKDLWAETSKARNEFNKTILAPGQQNIRRTIMKSPITKLAVAAVTVIAVLIVLSQFGGSDTSVVWAEVAQKVQASRSVIFRGIDNTMNSQNSESDYIMNYLSSTHSRLDFYKGDQVIKTIYDDFNTNTVILVDHLPNHKSYVKMTFENIEQSSFLTDPKSMVQKFLSCEHREIGQKVVEGMLCEGIETTDPTFDGSGHDYTTDSVMARIWVNVKTGYPVLLETKIVRNNGEIHIGGIMDQFQWDVGLDESMFEPEIPADYIDISP